MTHRIKINGQFRPSLEIDGHEFHAATAALSLDAESVPVLEVSLPITEGIDVTVEGAVWITEPTAEALKALGWTPPGAPEEQPS